MKFFTKLGAFTRIYQPDRTLAKLTAMAASPFARTGTPGTVVGQRPTTLSARAAERLAAGPLDAVTLMRDVCRVERLQHDAAERIALALLSSHEEFVRLPSGHWDLRDRAHRIVVQSTSDSLDATIATVGNESLGLSAIDFAVVDVETTGTRAGHGDRITEIAIARVRGGEIVEVYSKLVNPERPIPSYITELTHITWDMVKDQPPFRHVADHVTSRLAGHVFTAHNAAFDWRFVSEELSRCNMRLSGPRLCTVRMARALVPALGRRTLDHVTRYFGIDIDVASRHRAAGDAEATAKALLRMLRIATDEGIDSWSALEARLAARISHAARNASERRRRAFPMPAIEDYIA